MLDRYTLIPIPVAFGFVEIAGRRIPLPGKFWMRDDKPGYWVNDTTGIEVFWRGGADA